MKKQTLKELKKRLEESVTNTTPAHLHPSTIASLLCIELLEDMNKTLKSMQKDMEKLANPPLLVPQSEPAPLNPKPGQIR